MFSDNVFAVERAALIVVVVVLDKVRLIHVFIDGIIGIGTVGATEGCGLAITPYTARSLLNSSSHSSIAFFRALRG